MCVGDAAEGPESGVGGGDEEAMRWGGRDDGVGKGYGDGCEERWELYGCGPCVVVEVRRRLGGGVVGHVVVGLVIGPVAGVTLGLFGVAFYPSELRRVEVGEGSEHVEDGLVGMFLHVASS
jgi:hypothetical protein